jgi:glycosyltransferase involved in cell wall biosynthesis
MNTDKADISVVSPVYGCSACLLELCNRLRQSLMQLTENFEIILVNDASPDQPWQIIRSLAKADKRIKGIDLSRNFGQHYAITAGLDHARGSWVVVMDCDLQDQPEEIPRLYHKAMEGFDVVFARRADRQDRLLKRTTSKLFYRIFDYLTDQKSDPAIANFGIYSQTVIANVCRMRESARAFPLFVRWLGFNTTSIDVNHASRAAGRSSYTISKLIWLAINSIIAQSNRPLRVSVQAGFVIAAASLLAALALTLRYFIYGITVAGWTSILVSLWLIGGMLMMNLGFLGLYIGRIYDETKSRPLYVIRELRNLAFRSEA